MSNQWTTDTPKKSGIYLVLDPKFISHVLFRPRWAEVRITSDSKDVDVYYDNTETAR